MSNGLADLSYAHRETMTVFQAAKTLVRAARQYGAADPSKWPSELRQSLAAAHRILTERLEFARHAVNEISIDFEAAHRSRNLPYSTLPELTGGHERSSHACFLAFADKLLRDVGGGGGIWIWEFQLRRLANRPDIFGEMAEHLQQEAELAANPRMAAAIEIGSPAPAVPTTSAGRRYSMAWLRDRLRLGNAAVGRYMEKAGVPRARRGKPRLWTRDEIKLTLDLISTTSRERQTIRRAHDALLEIAK